MRLKFSIYIEVKTKRDNRTRYSVIKNIEKRKYIIALFCEKLQTLSKFHIKMGVARKVVLKWTALLLVSLVFQVEAQAPAPNQNCKTLIDLIVVVDGSDSITAGDFQTLRNAVVELIGEVHIGPGEARMGVVVYSTDIGAQVDVSDNVADLKYQTMNLPHPRDGTNTALGIRTMTNMFITQGRPNVPTVGIVITDGISKNKTETARQASIARSEGINMFAVGVTNLIDMNELRAIASSDNQVLSVTNFNELANSMKSLMMLVCPTTTTTTTPAPTTTAFPPMPPTTDLNGVCDKCFVLNGVCYASHPEACDKFVQCYFGHGGQSGTVQAIYRQCPFGTFWKQDLLSCIASNHIVCPTDPCQDASLFTYPYDIQNRRSFWKCYSGKSVAMCCPWGQSYKAYAGCEVDLTSTEQCPPQTEAPNYKTMMDLIVVVDGSDSITAGDFQTLRNALVELIEEVHIGSGAARMGVVVYGTYIGAQVDLSDNVADLKYQTMNLPHPRDGTNTALGIRTMTNMFITQRRPNVPTVGIVITDGVSRNPTETARQASIARSEGINMFAAGVTNFINMNELRAIASSDNQVLSFTNFNELANSIKSLIMLLWPTTTTTTTTATTTTPAPITTTFPPMPPTPDLNGVCDKCFVLNGVGYASHPEDCDKFVQCYFGHGGESGTVQAIYRQCPFGTFWKQDILSCITSNHIVCPTDPCQDASLVTYPYDLQNRRSFWKCYNGKSVAMCCPWGQSYKAYAGCEVDLTSTEQCPPQTETPNYKKMMDLIVVVDGSDSITAGDFQTLRNTLVELIGEVHIGPGAARMGVVVYGTYIGAQVDLSDNVADLKYQTMNLPHPRDGTNTALGIRTMTNMFITQRRPNVPTVGIVITDGISKNPTETARQASIARSEGINMFAVGVSTLIDMNELRAIASSDNQVSSFTNFNELANSIKSLIMLLWPTTTTTTTPVPVTSTFTYVPVTYSTSTPSSPVSPTPDANGVCDTCHVINGVGYASHPEACDKFVQCYFGNGGENGAVQAIYRQCPFGTFWKQDILSCISSNHIDCPTDPCQDASLVTYPYDLQNRRSFWKCYSGKSVAMCCPWGESYKAYAGCEVDPTSTELCPPQTKEETVCDKRAFPGNPAYFEQQMSGFGWVRMPCAPGTNYNPQDCGCTLNGTYTPERVCKPELYIPFDTDCQDHSGKNVYVRNENVTVENGAGFFDGNSRLLIPRFSNLNIQSEIVIKLRYREATQSMYNKNSGIEALVTNGDCGSSATLVIAKSLNHLHFGLKTTLGTVTSFSIDKPAAQWKEVVFIHDQMHLEGRVNFESVVQNSVGHLQDTTCDLQVGHGDRFGNFIGYIDEISVYLCRPDDV